MILHSTARALALCSLLWMLPHAASSGIKPPPVAREFRGMVVASVSNIDWPSAPGLPVEKQKSELLTILDTAKRLNFNAVLLQVRPACDALYDSRVEPWSEYLTGQAGKPPEPDYDPLAFAVDQAHRRGLELHAWINPYRARHPSAKSSPSAEHVILKHPEFAFPYGGHFWLDPGNTAARQHSIEVVRDIIIRYDVDGLRMDDYFYPYAEKDSDGRVIPFPDDASWQAYVESGGKLSRSDWRRENVNLFIQGVYNLIKAEKPWVKLGIAPFGIWRPGHPQGVTGFDAYEGLYCDSKKWLNEGWLDYISPQLYWKLGAEGRDYATLLRWWIEQNSQGRHLWPNLFSSRTGKEWEAEEILKQIESTRRHAGATGNGHFSANVFVRNRGDIAARLADTVYSGPALIPASTWLGDEVPGVPQVTIRNGSIQFEMHRESDQPWLWVVQSYDGDQWSASILPGALRQMDHQPRKESPITALAISAVNRLGHQSEAVVLQLTSE